MSTYNKCFRGEIRKIFGGYPIWSCLLLSSAVWKSKHIINITLIVLFVMEE